MTTYLHRNFAQHHPLRHKLKLVQIVVDPRDSRRDLLLPIAEAQHKFVTGELHWDVTNQLYCLPPTKRDL